MSPRQPSIGQPGAGRRVAVRVLSCLIALVLAVGAQASGSSDAETTSGRVEAVLINGGGQRAINYRSHLVHLRELHDLLLRAGVSRSQIAIFSSDGSDPASDLAIRDSSADESWMLEGTLVARSLVEKIRYIDSEVDGETLKPATEEALNIWFSAAASRLRAGDTLLLYVTDHGTKNVEDTSNNEITLWGKDKSSVAELRELLARLDAGVRVVALMSQCYSGSFANLMAPNGDGQPRGNVCGFFSSTEQRPAYGCYPENFDKKNVGHSFRFIDALRRDGRFQQAHHEVMVTDRSPDVPLKTSDVYLRNVLESAAAEREMTLNQLVDRLLVEAWENRAAWEREIRLLDRIGQAFGFFSPRSLAELEEWADQLPEVSRQFSRYHDAWRSAFHALNRENMRRFLGAERDWRPRVDEKALKELRPGDRRALADELLGELAQFMKSDAKRSARLGVLRQNTDDAQAAHYRMQVRLGALLRMKSVLTSVAGRVFLKSHPNARAHAALMECEALTLSVPATDEMVLETPEPFQSHADDLLLAERLQPGWIGIRFRHPTADERDESDLPAGAAEVLVVFPDSPAERAGIEVGDFLLGPPEGPFGEAQRFREWIMTSAIGETRPVAVRRGGDLLRLGLTPTSYPIELPALPGQPELGSLAPTLEDLKTYRGELPAKLTADGPYLLFFWATWCAPCKAAVPEVLAFERERGIRVIAITDERAADLEPFFESRDEPFPKTVAVDQRRRAFVAYGVSGTPSFVLVGEDGTVESTATGYNTDAGLRLVGWSPSEAKHAEDQTAGP